METERYERGNQVRRAVLGDEYVDRAEANQTALDYAAMVKAKGPVKAPKPATANKKAKAA